jgi:NAD(P)-dependent dehydrogenase (short-subunit alcohol dehydrogenase family)
LDAGDFPRPNLPLGRVGSAEEVAQTVFWLSSPQASYLTGVSLTVDGGAVLMGPELATG